jgi:pimeloyl-ACP methyl ester carboxylesterase
MTGPQPRRAKVQYAACGHVDLAYETFGSADNPTLALVMGLATQMLGWPDGFCEKLADAGLHVVRFDNRDIGLSTHLDDAPTPDLSPLFVGQPIIESPYLLADMAEDTVALLDAIGVERVHLAGASMGGMIAQEVALRHPDRLSSLISIMSTPAPQIGAATPEATAALFTPPATSAKEAGERAVAVYRIVGSPGYPLDEDALVARAEESFRRANDPAGVARQLAAIHASGDRTAALREVKVPTLVLHGEGDPLIQVSGGVATADAVPRARLITYPGMGHDLPQALWARIAGDIAEHVLTVTRPDAGMTTD